jgi:hypothetical protein
LRGTKIHPKNLHFLRPIKSFIFLKYMPRLHLLPPRISKFSGGLPKGGIPPSLTQLAPMPLGDSPVSAYFQKFSIYLKTFWEHWSQDKIIYFISAKENYSEVCLKRTSLGPTFVFGIDRCLVYTD